MMKALKGNSVYRTSLTLASWSAHIDGPVVWWRVGDREGEGGGGRPRRKRRVRECPSHLVEYIKSIALFPALTAAFSSVECVFLSTRVSV